MIRVTILAKVLYELAYVADALRLQPVIVTGGF
jgi:hypothetical protein